MNTPHLLVADIGGTSSRFALFRLEHFAPDATASSTSPDASHAPGAMDSPTIMGTPGAVSAVSAQVGNIQLSLVADSKVTLATQAHGSFRQLLNSLREVKSPGGFCLLENKDNKDERFKLIGASLAVPGPMQGGVCLAPNISWPLDTREACAALGLETLLLNDFAAQGLACLFPSVQGLHQILPGQPCSASPSIILGAGTGLGKAIILPPDRATTCPDQDGHNLSTRIPPAKEERLAARKHCGHSLLPTLSARILPSEGGHSLFPFRGTEEAAFEAFLRKVSGRREVIGDMVVTGYGLAALYAFHGGEQTLLPPPEVTPKLAARPAALEWLARFYGRACRNLLLETLALGGVRLSGGLLAHVPGLLGHPAFETEFKDSEGQAHLLAQVPVWWVSNQESGLWGAAIHGLERFLHQKSIA